TSSIYLDVTSATSLGAVSIAAALPNIISDCTAFYYARAIMDISSSTYSSLGILVFFDLCTVLNDINLN
ncbi:hypothetical protein, partial [Enterococcus faecium]|uniref:hypothetical protein n=1 Tax=Enterococcus faecium TaxID=1352 RepID=UPI0030C891F7